MALPLSSMNPTRQLPWHAGNSYQVQKHSGNIQKDLFLVVLDMASIISYIAHILDILVFTALQSLIKIEKLTMPFEMTLLSGQPCLFFSSHLGTCWYVMTTFHNSVNSSLFFLIEYILVGYGSKTSDLFRKIQGKFLGKKKIVNK